MGLDVFMYAEVRGSKAAGWRLLNPVPCPRCGGQGSAAAGCEECHGTGRTAVELHGWRHRGLPAFLGWRDDREDSTPSPFVDNDPIVTDMRGLPEAASKWWTARVKAGWWDLSQVSWLSASEVLAFDWDQPAYFRRGFITRDEHSGLKAGRIASDDVVVLAPDEADTSRMAYVEFDGPSRFDSYVTLVAVLLETLALPLIDAHLRASYERLRERAEDSLAYPRDYGGPPQRWDEDPRRLRFVYGIS